MGPPGSDGRIGGRGDKGDPGNVGLPGLNVGAAPSSKEQNLLCLKINVVS